MTGAAAGASLGTAFGVMAAAEMKDHELAARNLMIAAAVSTALGVGAGALGLNASASYHDQCVQPATVLSPAPIYTADPSPVPSPAPQPLTPSKGTPTP